MTFLPNTTKDFSMFGDWGNSVVGCGSPCTIVSADAGSMMALFRNKRFMLEEIFQWSPSKFAIFQKAFNFRILKNICQISKHISGWKISSSINLLFQNSGWVGCYKDNWSWKGQYLCTMLTRASFNVFTYNIINVCLFELTNVSNA